MAILGVPSCCVAGVEHSLTATHSLLFAVQFDGGPVGIEAIAATLQEESDTLVDIVEPYLLKIGFITRTSSGRKTSEDAYRHLGFATQEKIFR